MTTTIAAEPPEFAYTRWPRGRFITTWREFHRTVRPARALLSRLDDFPDSVLVAGCQRSGTTMLSRIITKSEGMAQYWFGPDDELDAALILAGYVQHWSPGRHCFQTTYVNRCEEYYGHHGRFRMVWVLRNPWSVVYSMLHNWSDDGIDRLFEECGGPRLSGLDALAYRMWPSRFSRLRRACLAYAGKTAQIVELRRRLGPDQLLVIEYDEMVTNKDRVLPAIYEFIGLEYRSSYGSRVQTASLRKNRGFSRRSMAMVAEYCERVYDEGRSCLSQL